MTFESMTTKCTSNIIRTKSFSVHQCALGGMSPYITSRQFLWTTQNCPNFSNTILERFGDGLLIRLRFLQSACVSTCKMSPRICIEFLDASSAKILSMHQITYFSKQSVKRQCTYDVTYWKSVILRDRQVWVRSSFGLFLMSATSTDNLKGK